MEYNWEILDIPERVSEAADLIICCFTDIHKAMVPIHMSLDTLTNVEENKDFIMMTPTIWIVQDCGGILSNSMGVGF